MTDNTPETLYVSAEGAEHLKKLQPVFEDYLKLVAKDHERMLATCAAKLTTFERLFIVSGGTFALSLTLVSSVHSSLNGHHLSLLTRMFLYLGWIALLLTILSSAWCWINLQITIDKLRIRHLKENLGHLSPRISQAAKIMGQVLKGDPISIAADADGGSSRTATIKLSEQLSTACEEYIQALRKAEKESENSDVHAVLSATALYSLCVGFISLFTFALRCAGILLN